jgi:hypothetical protein
MAKKGPRPTADASGKMEFSRLADLETNSRNDGCKKLSSPDGKTTAATHDAEEVGMGAPTSGRLRLSNGLTFESCNPSLVWSSDSVYLAVPQWTPLPNQRLLIISVTRRRHGYAPGEYRVLRLESSDQGVIRGIDSPVYQPRPVHVDLADIDWAGIGSRPLFLFP